MWGCLAWLEDLGFSLRAGVQLAYYILVYVYYYLNPQSVPQDYRIKETSFPQMLFLSFASPSFPAPPHSINGLYLGACMLVSLMEEVGMFINRECRYWKFSMFTDTKRPRAVSRVTWTKYLKKTCVCVLCVTWKGLRSFPMVVVITLYVHVYIHDSWKSDIWTMCNGFMATYFLVLCLVFPLPNVELGVSPSISAVNSCVSWVPHHITSLVKHCEDNYFLKCVWGKVLSQ